MRDTQFARDGRQRGVGAPQLEAADQSGGEQMDVYPAQAAPLEMAVVDEFNDLSVRNQWGLMKKVVGLQETPLATWIPN